MDALWDLFLLSTKHESVYWKVMDEEVLHHTCEVLGIVILWKHRLRWYSACYSLCGYASILQVLPLPFTLGATCKFG